MKVVAVTQWWCYSDIVVNCCCTRDTHRTPSIRIVGWNGESESEDCTTIHTCSYEQQAMPHWNKR